MKNQNSIKLFLVFIAFWATSVQAEYRVYQYYVKSRFSLPQDKNSYIVTSTLDPVSYVAYHGGYDSLKVDLLRSWTCVGHTGAGKELCEPVLESFNEQERLNQGRL